VLAVCLHEGLGYRETQPRAAPGVTSAEHLEQTLAVGSWHTGTMVRDRHPDRGGRGNRAHGDRSALRRETRRVLEQVRESLNDEQPVDVDERDILGQIHVQVRGSVGRAERSHCVIDDRFHAHRLQSRLERTGLYPGHVEQVGDEPVQTVCLALDQTEHLAAVRARKLCVRFAQARYGDLDRGERGTQVMRDGADERLAQPVDLLERSDLLGGLAKLGALECERQVVGERPEQVAVLHSAWPLVKH